MFPNSPLMDLLDNGNYTLEDLLREDELIQEVKAKNDRLIEFMSLEESVDKLIDYIITPADVDASDDRKFKYPYMSCEILCCEVLEILQVLTQSDDSKLVKLFSFLDADHDLDCHLAGYFEKILEMLFRNATSYMMNFFNERGVPLLKSFLKHVSNYSIMQIVQRLMLPHLPFCLQNNGSGENECEQCNWSFLPETCQMLLPALLNATHADEPLHVSDMLITVLQLSAPDTLLVEDLSKPQNLHAMLSCATDRSALTLPKCTLESHDSEVAVKANISLAATSVLESLVSRLFESCFPTPGEAQSAAEQQALLKVQDQLTVVCNEIVAFVPKIAAALRSLHELRSNNASMFQSKVSSPRLGHHGLQLVKLVESLTRVGFSQLDRAFCDASLFDVCLDLFCDYEYNSVLHLSVQRIFVSIFESGSNRSETQQHVCKSRLLPFIMGHLGAEDSVEGTAKLSYFRADVSHATFSARHSSLVGNLVLIAHAAFLMLDSTEREEPPVSETPNNVDSNGVGLTIDVDGDHDKSNVTIDKIADKESQERAQKLRDEIADAELLSQWDYFSFVKLKEILDHQMLGSYEVPAMPALTEMQHEMALLAEMDPFEFEDEDHNGYDDFEDNGGHGNELDFGATLRQDDAFWAAAEEDSDEAPQPDNASSPVFEDFADFSGFEAGLSISESPTKSGAAQENEE